MVRQKQVQRVWRSKVPKPATTTCLYPQCDKFRGVGCRAPKNAQHLSAGSFTELTLTYAYATYASPKHLSKITHRAPTFWELFAPLFDLIHTAFWAHHVHDMMIRDSSLTHVGKWVGMKSAGLKNRQHRVLQLQQLENRELFAADSGLGGSFSGGANGSLPGLYSSDPASSVPAPFWRKSADVPSVAPAWYQNVGPVTREVFYNPSLTPAQNGAALKTVLTTLPAGSRIMIHEGTYSIDSYFVITAQGTESQPVVIEGAPGEKVSITRINGLQNVVNIDNSRFLLMRNLDIYGGSTGVKIQSVSDFMLYDSKIHHVGDNAVAANSKNTSRLYFVDNEISYTGGYGEGFYLGSHDGVFKTNNSFVVGNYLHHLANGASAQGDGIEIKDGSYANVVKYNFVDGTKYPGITVYRTGRGAVDRNVIEENVVINTIDAGIQVTADAIVRNNLVIGKSTAFVSKPFTTNPGNMVVSNNTFLGGGTTVRLTNWLTTDLAFANNAIHSPVGQFYSSSRTGRAIASGNVNVSNLTTTFVNLKLDGSALNARPVSGSSVIGKATASYLPSGDLNGAIRITRMDSGAVDFTGDSTTVTQLRSSQDKVKPFGIITAGSTALTVAGVSEVGAQRNEQVLKSSVSNSLLSPSRFTIASVSKSDTGSILKVAKPTVGQTPSSQQMEISRASLLTELVDELNTPAW